MAPGPVLTVTQARGTTGAPGRTSRGRGRARTGLLALIAISLLTMNGEASARKPNLLFILTDNQPASILGAYGNPDVRTPHIDQLASEGMQFTRAFAVSGMCSPTRATLMTGLMPSQHGVHNWLDDKEMQHWPREWSAIAEFRTLPLTLRNRGYQTALIGKWHLGQPWKASIGYQHWITFTDGHTVDFWNNTVIENDDTYPVRDQHIVDFFTDKAVDYLKSYRGDSPFYLQLNYDGPYLNPPTNQGPAKNRHYQSYLGQAFSSFPRVAFNANVAAQLLDPSLPKFLQNMHLAAISQHNDLETMANVASQNTVVDDGVGRVLATLKEAGLERDTLVIFSSDQGNFYGQHGLWQHTTVTTPSNLYEDALNIPLIIRQPGVVAPGSSSSELIGQYDIPVTILDYLEITDATFDNSPGHSFAGRLRGEDVPLRTAVFYEQEESRGIRTQRFAYWKRLPGTGSDEFYDMDNDPGQHHNVIDNPAYKQVLGELDRQLLAHYSRYSESSFDLWQGGSAKGSVMRPGMFRKLYGTNWATRTDQLPPFRE